MSEGDVSLIHDEDVLRRMWQQTEDFSRKKEIRAHMYKLREERLKLLYSPEPARKDISGSLISTLADDGFGRAKRQEVRGGPSPPRDKLHADHAFRTPPELQALSTAGWSVQSENSREDGGATRVSSVRADISGGYDVTGGRGQFTASDKQKQAITEKECDKGSYRRQENVADTARSDSLVQRTEDGTIVTTSKQQQHRSNVQHTSVTRDGGEITSNPDEQVVVEKMPDGSVVTTTRQQRAESRSYSSSQHSSSQISSSQHSHSTKDIVESQRLADERDFERNHTKHVTRDDSSQTHSENILDSRESKITRDNNDKEYASKKGIEEDYQSNNRRTERHETATGSSSIDQKHTDEVDRSNSVVHSNLTSNKVEQVEKTSSQYQTTYQSDYTEKKIHSEWSATHQAWASTLRGDSPDKGRRGGSPDKGRRDGSPDKRRHRSPNKSDRGNSTDRYSTSTYSVSSDRYTSPERKGRVASSPDRKPQSSPTRPRASPDSAPGYMRSTHSSQSHTSQSHAVDQETKVYSRQQARHTDNNSPSPDRLSNPDTKDRSSSPSILRKASRSPSPPKGPVSFTQDETDKYRPTEKQLSSNYDRSEKKTKYGTYDNKHQTENVTKVTKQESVDDKYNSLTRCETTARNSVSPTKTPDSPCDTSPSKYATYDRKQRYEQVDKSQNVTSKQSSDVRYDSLTRRPKSDTPRKEARPSPTKNTRESTSPVKSPTKNVKLEHTNNFIATERTCEEINRKTRQLVTPSSSPTRRPTEPTQVPSTGQSSPTTSVSEFVYYGSPTVVKKTIVTDLDDDEYFTLNTTEQTASSNRPDSLEHKRSPSPSKIPCRSPSPKKASPVKEMLPRKSSLKKPTLTNLPSPVEKPPSTFQVSPTTETQPEHKVVKKDRADKPVESDVKPKPTLERRETYTERCLKILGVIDDNTNVARKELSPRSRSSPGIGTDVKLTTTFKSIDRKRAAREHVTDFIAREQEDTRSKSTSERKSKTPSRESSPTKLKDITSTKSVSSNVTTTGNRIVDRETGYRQPNDVQAKPVKIPTRLSQSPEKKPKDSSVRASPSPERKPGHQKPNLEKETRQARSSRSSMSPDRKPSYTGATTAATKIETTSKDVSQVTMATSDNETADIATGYQAPKRTPLRSTKSPSCKSSIPDHSKPDQHLPRSSASPDRTPGYMKSTIASKRHEPSTDSHIDSETTNVEDIRTSSYQSEDYMKSTISSKLHESTTEEQIDSETTETEDMKNLSYPSHDYMKSTISSQLHESTNNRPIDYDTTEADGMRTSSHQSHDYMKSTISSKLHESTTEKQIDSETTESEDMKILSYPSHDYMKSTISSQLHESTNDRPIDCGTTEADDMRTSSHQSHDYMKSTISSKHHDSATEKQIDSETKKVEGIEISSHPSCDYMKPTVSSKLHESTNDRPIYCDTTEAEDMRTSSHQSHDYMKSTMSSKLHESITDKQIDSETKEVEDIDTSSYPSHNYMKSTISTKLHETTIGRPIDSETKATEDIKTLSYPSHDYSKSTISSRLHESKTDGHIDSDTMELEETRTSSHTSRIKHGESKHSRTPSPAKMAPGLTHNVTEFIQSEREKEILDRVQTSLSKLSPSRERPASREKSPAKSTLSLQDIDVVTPETVQTKIDNKVETKQQIDTVTNDVTGTSKFKDDKPKQKTASTTPSRTVSPTKKPISSIPSKTPEFSYKARSTSPRKTVERPQSPQVPKQSGIKPRETTLPFIKKNSKVDVTQSKTDKNLIDKSTITKVDMSQSKIDKNATDNKSTVTKQNNVSKTSMFKSVASKFMNKTESETKRIPAPKENKENVSPRKGDAKMTRATSDHIIKGKKPSPQRIKSKPEIQVVDMTPSRPGKSAPNKTVTKEPQSKLAPKPKSATALNMPSDEDDVIIDVEQAKSSRENSPERRSMCPTPVGWNEDVGTPRLPDEVSEPDDEVRRHHHTIHETESVADDIVEISEEEELISSTDHVTQSDECLLSVTDKVSRFTDKIHSFTKPKDSTAAFKDTERMVHSDFTDDKLKSDECLLSVSEKVNKFAKGPRKEKSPARKVTDEYDTETVYQDDYTKLSVNDKAHLFVETAESSKLSPPKPAAPPVTRPDLSGVDETLRSDDCLLSVSDKVNKFVRTAEQFLNDSAQTRQSNTDKLVKERYEHFIKQLQEDEVETRKVDSSRAEKTDRKSADIPSFAKETASSHTKAKDYVNPHVKQPLDKAPMGKITALRSSEAVKKAKALFENITTTTKDTKTKLLDIGVMKKSPKTDSTIALHPSDEESPATDSEAEACGPQPDREAWVRNGYTNMPPHVSSSTKSVLTRYPAAKNDQKLPEKKQHVPKQTPAAKSPERQKPQEKVPRSQKSTIHQMKDERVVQLEPQKPQEKGPGSQGSTSQVKDDRVALEEIVSTRRGSGQFGVELRRTSAGERGGQRGGSAGERRPSLQPCIEDVFDVQVLEQMLEKVVGYEQRRRIRSQIRVAKKRMEEQHSSTKTTESHSKTTETHNKTTDNYNKTTETRSKTTTRSPGRQPFTSPERKVHNTSPNTTKISQIHVVPEPARETKPLLNGHAKESGQKLVRPQSSEKQLRSQSPEKRVRPQSPEKQVQQQSYEKRVRSPEKQRSPPRLSSDDKRNRPASPTKATSRTNTNRFSEYASAYMKKVGIDDNLVKKTGKVDIVDTSVKKSGKIDIDNTFVKKTSKVDNNETSFRKTGKVDNVKKTDDRQMENIINTSSQMEQKTVETKSISKMSRFTERMSSQETMTAAKVNGKRSPSPGDRLYQRSPSPDFKRRQTTNTHKGGGDHNTTTTTTTVYQADRTHEEKPAWVTTRTVNKVWSESSSNAQRGSSTVEAITSSYGPGPRGPDGRPLFGIRALRTTTTTDAVAVSEPPPQSAVCADSLTVSLRQRGPRPRLHGLAALTATHNTTTTTTTTATTNGKHTARDSTPPAAPHAVAPAAAARPPPQRQASVKTLTDKYIKTTTNGGGSERRDSYPKAGLILRSGGRRDKGDTHIINTSTSPVECEPAMEHHHQQVQQQPGGGVSQCSFLDSSTKVSGVQDILARMKNADIVVSTADTGEEREARALLNKFLGATVLMAGMQSYVTGSGAPAAGAGPGRTTATGHTMTARTQTQSVSVGVRCGSGEARQVALTDEQLAHCWDERLLREQLEACTDYEQRRRVRTRLRALMAEQEACTAAVTEALGGDSAVTAATTGSTENKDDRDETEVSVSVREDSAERTTTTTTTTNKVVENMTRPAPKPVSPFAKFKQLEKQNSTSSQNSGGQSPGSGGGALLFKFTDPALHASALTIKERLLQWCRDKTRDYENVKLENFSTSWADGLAFCALLHHFLPDAFDYSALDAKQRRHNFTLAFKVADEKAGIYPLLDVDDMVAMRKPDWKCVFTYVQAIHRRFKDQP